MSALRILICSLLLSSLLACGGSDSSENNAQACTVNDEKQAVLAIMQDWYLWNDKQAQFDKYRNLDLSAYSSVDALLNFLRYQPTTHDRNFTYLTTPAAEAAFFDAGAFIGFGFSMVRVANENDIRLAKVYSNSPAADAGFERGDQLLEIDGRSIATINANEGLGAALGPSVAGISASLKIAPRDGGVARTHTLSKRQVTIEPVPISNVLTYNAGTEKAGYFYFDAFINTAPQQLRSVFADFKLQNIKNLIVDLRYNGGGALSVADLLGDLMMGIDKAGSEYYTLTHNAAHADRNIIKNFMLETESLQLDNVVFITGEGSASASELIINGLLPYFKNVTGKSIAIVGERSHGKPVGQIGFDYCDGSRRMRAVSFKLINASDNGDYFTGLPVDCAIEDDLTAELGDASEASIAAALHYIENKTCPVATVSQPGGRSFAKSADFTRLVRGDRAAKRYAGAY